MNFNSLEPIFANTGVEMSVTHPVTGQPLKEADGSSVSITLLGSDGRKVREAVRVQIQVRMDAAAAGRALSAEEMEHQNLEVLAAATKGWKNIALDGKPLDFSHDAAADLYERFAWLREQVQAFYTERENFMEPLQAA